MSKKRQTVDRRASVIKYKCNFKLQYFSDILNVIQNKDFQVFYDKFMILFKVMGLGFNLIQIFHR